MDRADIIRREMSTAQQALRRGVITPDEYISMIWGYVDTSHTEAERLAWGLIYEMLVKGHYFVEKV